ncbi:MAG: ABC transporter ATP-binding protein [Candidatus Kapaibacterium sp.]|nr:ABC transporter ATP-binding protein/permease [Bacteroidota bacterium]
MLDLQQLVPYLKKHRRLLLLGLCFVTISNICSAFYPRFIGDTVNLLHDGNYTINMVLIKVSYILLLTIGSGFFMYLTRKTIIVASRKIEYDLRDDLLKAIERQSLDYFTKTPTGSLMAHSTNDIAAIREFIGPAIMYSANTITTFTFVVSLMLSISIPITLVALLPLPLIALTTFTIGKRVHLATRDVQNHFGVLTTQAQEVFSGIRIVRTFVREMFEKGVFSESSKKYILLCMRLARLQSLTMPLLMLLVVCSQLLVLGFGGLKVIEGSAQLGDLSQFFIYLNQLMFPVAAIGWVTNIVQRAKASMQRLGTIMNSMPTIINQQQSATITEINSIEFKNVSFMYSGSTKPVLDSISLSIPKLSSLGIVGNVGSGKSSFIKLLPRLYDVTSGSIEFNGTDIQQYNLSDIRNSTGVVLQEPFLFSMSILENMKIGKANATMEEVIEAAKTACLYEEVLSFPKGFETIIGERGISLSGGQKQRLAIARALLRKPQLLILDDALSAVDTSTESTILKNLRQVFTNTTSVIIAHRISTVQNCTNIIVLDSGKIIEQGTHNELIALNGHYAEMHRYQLLEAELLQ